MNNTLPTALHKALFHWAQSQPEQPFLLAEPVCSYQQAANYVSALATVLMPAKRTAIWLNKNNHYVLSILAALSADSAYIPIDAKQPINRVELILTDGQVDTLLVDAAHLNQAQAALHAFPHIKLITLVDTYDAAADFTQFVWHEHISNDQSPPVSHRQKDDLATILFTSGSTGRPKGVKLSLGNLQHFIDWTTQSLSLSNHDRFLNIASFNFDISTFDLFSSLSVGASLYVADDDAAKQPLNLATILKEQRITTMYTVPSLLSLMNRIGLWEQAAPLSLTHVIFAGETMPKPCLQALANNIKDCTFYNFYGPTETNVCLAYHVTDKDILTNTSLPIGSPIGDAQVWLVDESHQQVTLAEGASGELVVKGSCVTQGYCHDAQRHTSHQHHVHHTGDIVQFSNGLFYFLGRRDRMIKVAGYRIELGEIEAQLSHHPEIKEVAVRFCDQSTKIIVTYSPQDISNKPSSLQLKAYCAEQLPVYMIPHKFKALAQLPKNANGKIDYPEIAKVDS
ncbi:hypothetical protein PCIT_b0264 [Pseudoalteromonas citrea]|uniref:Peptide synthetase n=2 Tax=Pseudoalteromonas citrea TaxID=43655 RepID=A0AAD4AEE1_9GAMM|nr:AMP-binding protein [Pseudoalteromonas citrea]KAF7764303.1 hypothetical protein PCIT_b0264 [Pseudoalteromonas citrea]